MKPIEKDKLNQLLQIIQNEPGQRIVHFVDDDHTFIPHLSDFCKKQETTYYLHCTTELSYDRAINAYDAQHISHFNLKRPRYKIQGIEYDYVISTLNFKQEDKNDFLKKCYDIIKTAGNIIIFIPNTTYAQRDEWKTLLEEHYYVSTTIIDDLFTDIDVVISKRMHGWGNK